MNPGSKKIRVGVIGVGYLGKFHAEKYAGMDHVALVGVVDIQRSKAEHVAVELGTRAYTRFEDLFGKVDAVSVVVPTSAHFSVGKAFLDQGIDVMMEKPMATCLEEADTLIHAAESQGRVLQIGHLERFNPAVEALPDIVDHPMFIESHRLSIFRNRSTDVSVVLDLMIHDIDIILSFVKADVKSIHAAGIPVIGEQIDIANARLEFENGCVANVTASRISAKDQRKIRLFQKDAYVSVDFAGQEITVIRRDGNSFDALIPGMAMEQISFSAGDALENELKAFVDAVARRRVPQVSGRVGRRALKIALDIMEKINTAISRYLGSRP